MVQYTRWRRFTAGWRGAPCHAVSSAESAHRDGVRSAGEHHGMRSDLRAWFEREGMLRYAVVGEVSGEVVEQQRVPMVALGPGDADFVEAPHPARASYPGRPLGEMSLEDYNRFVFR